MDFEHVLVQVGSFGKYQKLLLLFLIPVSILSSFQSNTIFLELTPDHWCSVPEMINFSFGEQHRFIRPVLTINQSKPVVESCLMFDIDYRQVARDLRLPQTNKSSKLKVKVVITDGFTTEPTIGIVLLCIDGFSLISTVRLIGCILGTPIFGLISDIYGRRISYLLILITASISSISPLLCKEYTVFVICQFIIGLTYPSSHLIIFIMILEFMGLSHRAKVVSYLWICLSLGACMHSIIIYFIPHWIWLTALNTALVLPLILALRFIPESPQWLLAKQNYEIAQQNFQSIMRFNGKSIPVDLLSMQIQKVGKNKINIPEEKLQNNIVMKYLKDTTLFQMWLILTLCFVVNFMTNQIFEEKKFKFYSEILVNTFFWSLVTSPAILVAWFLIQRRIGRRWTNAIILCMIGFTLIGFVLTPKCNKTMIFAISLLGILLNKASVMITYLQVVELSPTKTRCLAITISITVATLIVTIINYIYDKENFNYWLPLMVLSIMCLLTSFLSSFVNETLNENMPQNLSSAENLVNKMTYWRLAKRKSDLKTNIFISLSKWNINQIDELDNT